jgi:glucose/arabinose dehydrogenase
VLRKIVFASFVVAALPLTARAAQNSPSTLVDGLKNPRGIAVTDDGRVFVSIAGEPGKDGDGTIVLIENGKATPFASGLDEPKGIVWHRDLLFVADKSHLWKIDRSGKAEVLAAADAFPTRPQDLTAIAVEYEKGTLFVVDSGGGKAPAAIYRVTAGGTVEPIVDAKNRPELGTPSGILLDGAAHVLVTDAERGTLSRVKLADGTIEKLVEGLGGPRGLTWNQYGRLFICDNKNGQVLAIPRPGEKPVAIATGLSGPIDVAIDRAHNLALVVDARANSLSAVKIEIPGAEVDATPLPLEATIAYPKLQWTGWSPETAEGKIIPLRPIVLTHAGDNSHRTFVATQHGVIHVFPNDQNAEKTEIFLDIQDRVRYNDKSDEEGFLGLAFPPSYKEKGEFIVFYTPKKAKRAHTNLISRFRVRKDNPNQADPASEEVLLRVEHPFWNHDGGTVAFGPDGYLYVALGDGGAAADPFGNGQNLNTLLGKILRIDVEHRDGDKPYAIPKDNPFVGRDGVRPEIWCYGLRNVWRFSFDRETGVCWAGDVGQDLWEEIDLLVPGGNYGWNLREALHPFGAHGVGPRKDLIDPIWEYHHSFGKSITGGGVYRGKQLPELAGAFLYADYVSGTVFALRYDPAKRRVVANQPIRTKKLPIVSFGEDETGEMYFLSIAADGRGINRFEKTKLAQHGRLKQRVTTE